MNGRLYRSVDDRVIAGVCGGLADRLDLDPALVRIGYAALALLSTVFPLVVLYVIMVIVVPEEPGWAGVRPIGPQPSGAGPTGAGWSTAGAAADEATQAAEMVGDSPAATGEMPAEPTPPVPGAVPGWIPPGGSTGLNARSWGDDRSGERAARRADQAARRAARRSDPVPAVIAGLCLVALGAFFLVRDTFAIDWSVVWPVAIVAFGVVVLVAAFRPRSG